MGPNIRWGVSRGVGIALVYCVWVTAVYLISGSEPFNSIGVTYASVVTTYLGVGAASGLLIGALKPITVHRSGAYFVGLLAGIPVGVGLILCVSGPPSRWTEAEWVLIPIMSIGWGLVIGRQLDPKRGPTEQL
jgi:hypothetical protein